MLGLDLDRLASIPRASCSCNLSDFCRKLSGKPDYVLQHRRGKVAQHRACVNHGCWHVWWHRYAAEPFRQVHPLLLSPDSSLSRIESPS